MSGNITDKMRHKAQRANQRRRKRHDKLVWPRIKELLSDGHGYGVIAKRLSAEGIPPPGKQWSGTAVWRIDKRCADKMKEE